MLVGLVVIALFAVLNAATSFQLPPRTSLTGRTGCFSEVKQRQSSVTEFPAAETRHDSGNGSDQFDWHKQWYPVLAEKHTDTERAHAVQLLGKELVVWRNNEGRWTCFDDRCPHRATPLTEGRLEKDGTLMCAYHAWRFDADGKCKKIPQSTSGGRDEAQPKACVKVAQGMIWVWAENGPCAGLESALTQPPLLPEYPGMKITTSTISQRNMPFGWDFSVENLMDPAHHPTLHRYAELPSEAPFEMTLERPVTKEGFATAFPSLLGEDRHLIEFIPPTLEIVDLKLASFNITGETISVSVRSQFPANVPVLNIPNMMASDVTSSPTDEVFQDLVHNILGKLENNRMLASGHGLGIILVGLVGLQQPRRTFISKIISTAEQSFWAIALRNKKTMAFLCATQQLILSLTLCHAFIAQFLGLG